MRTVILVITMIAFAVAAVYSGVKNTKHNLSASGPGKIKAQSERRICIFCHTPHTAPTTPLWNHDLSAVTNYSLYWSPTLDVYKDRGAAPQPDGVSKLCLSCHDGTVALGAIASVKRKGKKIDFVGGMKRLPPTAKGYIGTDISGMHPISFVVSNAIIAANNARNSPLSDLATMKSDKDGVKLDPSNRIQCNTCHDPHNDDNRKTSGVPFWRKSTWSGVCKVCHAF